MSQANSPVASEAASQATVLSFEEAVKARAQDRPERLTDAFLRRRQRTMALADCHVAFQDVTYGFKVKTRRLTLFNRLSVAFPKGRKITILGHKGSGKSALIELLIGQTEPLEGRVFFNSNISFPLLGSAYFDFRLTVRQNIKFVCGVMGMPSGPILRAALSFSGLSPRQLDDPMRTLSAEKLRQISLLLFLGANVECRVFDGPFMAGNYGLTKEAGNFVRARLYETDYVGALTETWAIPDNCDLAYLLYEGRLYMFEDVAKAIDVFKALPTPAPLAPSRPRGPAQEAADDATVEVF